MDETVIIQTITITLLTAIITLLFNGLFHWLKNKFDWFIDVRKFKREHSYTQLKELYFPAYAVVAQSEFLRRFYDLDDKPYDEIPFVEIKKTASKVVTNLKEGTIKRENVNISDVITEFNKEKLAKLIIDKGIFASQELLKLAVAYRYVNMYYTDQTLDTDKLEKFQVQELDLINRLVRLIIKECNEKLRECGMAYNTNEIDLETMLIDYNPKEKK